MTLEEPYDFTGRFPLNHTEPEVVLVFFLCLKASHGFSFMNLLAGLVSEKCALLPTLCEESTKII
jgi:hypothetical protein